jgi:ABC-type multidrug transport system fused ATPase/permease subunit
MKKILNNSNLFFNKDQIFGIVIFFLISFLLPFFELISIGSLAALILFILDINNTVALIPIVKIQNILLDFNKLKLIYYFSFIFLFVVIVKNIFLFFYFIFESKLKRSISNHHAILIFNNYINKEYIEHTLFDNSSLQNDILNQSRKISDYIFFYISLVKDIFISLFFISTLFLINFKATSFFIILCCILSLLFYFITNKKIKYIGNTVRFLEFELIKIVKNAFNGIKTVIIFNKQSFFQNKFFKIISQKKTNEQLHEIISKLPKLFLEIVFTVAIVVFINFFIKTDIDLQSFLPFLIFLSLISIRMLPIFSNLNSTFVSIRYMEPVVKKMINVILTVNNNVKSIFINNKLSFRNINNIEFNNVSFEYSGTKESILNNISFRFFSNKIYALVGKTGSGKSTLLDLAIGAIQPVNGNILANGINISKNITEWRNIVGYVPQDNFLLNDTILNNVCFGEEYKKINQSKFKEAIEKSDLTEFINSLPGKEHTYVGDRGIRISGGQKQRIGLARALYEDRIFLALDEATSAIDGETEDGILKTLHKIKRDKVIIIIAHRESTIDSCDEIIFLKDGKLEKITDV